MFSRHVCRVSVLIFPRCQIARLCLAKLGKGLGAFPLPQVIALLLVLCEAWKSLKRSDSLNSTARSERSRYFWSTLVALLFAADQARSVVFPSKGKFVVVALRHSDSLQREAKFAM